MNSSIQHTKVGKYELQPAKYTLTCYILEILSQRQVEFVEKFHMTKKQQDQLYKLCKRRCLGVILINDKMYPILDQIEFNVIHKMYEQQPHTNIYHVNGQYKTHYWLIDNMIIVEYQRPFGTSTRSEAIWCWSQDGGSRLAKSMINRFDCRTKIN